MSAAAAPQLRDPEHSVVRNPRNHEAVTPNLRWWRWWWWWRGDGEEVERRWRGGGEEVEREQTVSVWIPSGARTRGRSVSVPLWLAAARCDPLCLLRPCGSCSPGGHVAADVVEADRVAESVENALDADGRDLHTRVDGRSDRPAERIPRLVVKPVEEGVPAILVEVLGGAVVEPRVEFVNDGAVCVKAGAARPSVRRDANA